VHFGLQEGFAGLVKDPAKVLVQTRSQSASFFLIISSTEGFFTTREEKATSMLYCPMTILIVITAVSVKRSANEDFRFGRIWPSHISDWLSSGPG